MLFDATRGVNHFSRFFDCLGTACVVMPAGVGLLAAAASGAIHGSTRLTEHTRNATSRAARRTRNQGNFSG